MSLYRFKTFTTSYYFPRIERGQEFMYGLYSAYGSLPSKVFWWLFRNVGFVRHIFQVNEHEVDFPLLTIRQMDGAQNKMAFNMGSLGNKEKFPYLGGTRRRNLFLLSFRKQKGRKP